MNIYRDTLSNAVYRSIEILPNAVLYGSFKKSVFHYDQKSKKTFSDIDLVIADIDYKKAKKLQTLVSAAVESETGTWLFTSIRSAQIHNENLPPQVVKHVAFFELVYKLRSKAAVTREFVDYQLAKFFLRVLSDNQYFTNPSAYKYHKDSQLSPSDYSLLMSIKTESKIPLARSVFHRLLKFVSKVEMRYRLSRIYENEYCEEDDIWYLPESKDVFLLHRELYMDLERKLFIDSRVSQ